VIERYTRAEMGAIWTEEAKFSALLEVELSVAKVQSEMGIIPKAAYADIKKKSKFSVKHIHEIEKTTKHDVIAFVSNVAENVGANGRFLHFGMTSSDVLDTALSLQIRRASQVLFKSVNELEKKLKEKIKSTADVLCAGRTHGIHAEPVTLGLKFAGFYEELKRNKARLEHAVEQCQIVKLSGAVGSYSSQPPEVEEKVGAILGLTPETVATQVIPRDRFAELFCSFAILGGGLERLATEIRHLQRTEVGELREGFSKGQKGSSAMPHKRNPIGSENVTGCARLLRSYALAALEDIPLWHERDISHSSVERVIFPDAFILADYATMRMAQIVSDLEIDAKRMKKNMEISQGQLFSSHVLLKLVEKGLSREDAYKHVQRVSHSLKPDQDLRSSLLADKEVSRLLKKSELDEVFSGKTHLAGIKKTIQRALKEK
jgi:adenylosuccinate lyase